MTITEKIMRFLTKYNSYKKAIKIDVHLCDDVTMSILVNLHNSLYVL